MPLLDERGRLFGRISIVDLGAALLILLTAGPALYFAWEIRSAAPYISRVDPMETVISTEKDIPLVVRGKWFDPECVTRLGDTPMVTMAANTQRLDLQIPTQKILPGSYLLTVTNKRGLSITWKEPVRLLCSPPRIKEVHQLSSERDPEVRVVVVGENFDSKTTVQIENWSLEVTRRGPTRLEAHGLLSPNMKRELYPIQIANSYGQADRRDKAIRISPAPAPAPAAVVPVQPAPAPAPAAVVPVQPAPAAEPVPVQVFCIFEEPEVKTKRSLIKAGAVTYAPDNRPIAKILKVQTRIQVAKDRRPLILATLVLACTRDLSSSDEVFLYGAGLRGHPPEGEPVKTGKRLVFQFRSLDIEGTVLDNPVPLNGNFEKYLAR